MTVSARAPIGRFPMAVVAAALAASLAACSSSHPSTLTGPVGTSVGVALSSSTGTTQVQQGATIVFTATVTADTGNSGVTWNLNGQGQLLNVTSTTVTYQAPTGITGTTSPILTATSVADGTKTASALIVVLGTPVMNATTLFPANLNILYSAQVSVAGGLAPYAWSLSGGALPPGITLGATTIAFTALAGTPTAEGIYSFQVKVTDANNASATVDLTMVVKPAAACLIEGQYASVYSGFVNGAVAVSAVSVNISPTGTITGYHNFNGPGANPIAETVTGTCATRTANNGLLTLAGQANSPTYNFAMTVGLLNGRVQLVNGGDVQSGTGPLEKQDPASFDLTKLAGDFAFGALGAQANGSRAGIAGTLSIDTGGVVTTGHVDSNDSSPMTDAVVAGALSSPDANGYGTLSLTATLPSGSRSLNFAYYVVTADRLFIVSTDKNYFVSGFMTRRATSVDNTTLATPGILNLWGAGPGFAPKSVISLGRFSGADSTAGTINLVLDTANLAVSAYSQAFNGATYAVRADGRTTIALASGGVTSNLVGYLAGTASGYTGYFVQPGSTTGNAGIIESQSPGPFTTSVPGLFVSGVQYPEDEAPIVLMPSVHLSDGSFTASYANGYFTMDPVTGRGVGSLSITGVGVAAYTFYVVRPDKVLTLRMPTQYTSAGLSWLTSD